MYKITRVFESSPGTYLPYTHTAQILSTRVRLDPELGVTLGVTLGELRACDEQHRPHHTAPAALGAGASRRRAPAQRQRRAARAAARASRAAGPRPDLPAGWVRVLPRHGTVDDPAGAPVRAIMAHRLVHRVHSAGHLRVLCLLGAAAPSGWWPPPTTWPAPLGSRSSRQCVSAPHDVLHNTGHCADGWPTRSALLRSDREATPSTQRSRPARRSGTFARAT